MATRKKPCKEATAAARRGMPPAYYHLHALLQTLRALQSHEDELCALLHHIQHSGRIGARLRHEITELLSSLPTASLDAEVQAAYSAIEEAAA